MDREPLVVRLDADRTGDSAVGVGVVPGPVEGLEQAEQATEGQAHEGEVHLPGDVLALRAPVLGVGDLLDRHHGVTTTLPNIV